MFLGALGFLGFQVSGYYASSNVTVTCHQKQKKAGSAESWQTFITEVLRVEP